MFDLSKPYENIEGLFKIAEAYRLGIGKNVDCQKAFVFYSVAASKGNLDALACLGYCYLNGKGVELNVEKGLSYIRDSANKIALRGKIL